MNIANSGYIGGVRVVNFLEVEDQIPGSLNSKSCTFIQDLDTSKETRTIEKKTKLQLNL